MNKRRRYLAKRRRRCGVLAVQQVDRDLRSYEDSLIAAVEAGRIYTSDDNDKQHLLMRLEIWRDRPGPGSRPGLPSTRT